MINKRFSQPRKNYEAYLDNMKNGALKEQVQHFYVPRTNLYGRKASVEKLLGFLALKGLDHDPNNVH